MSISSRIIFSLIGMVVIVLAVFVSTWVICPDLEAMQTMLWIQGVGAFIVLVGAVVVIMNVQTRLAKPLAAICDYAGAISSGKLETKITGTFIQELGELSACLTQMVDVLLGVMKTAQDKEKESDIKSQELHDTLEATRKREEQVAVLLESLQKAAQNAKNISSEVTSSVRDLTAEVDQVTEGVQITSDRMTDTATAMEEMNATVLEVARNASDAASNAVESREKAETGAQGVRHAVDSIQLIETRIMGLKETMADLGAQAQSIGEVLRVINDIADQTNLLALNAAIEAARAGDAGRGFAVVADEVRKLAEKTMTATQEVEGAIKSIQDVAQSNMEAVDATARDIVESTEAATQSGQYMEDIVRIVSETSMMVEAIAAASGEQSAASDEINSAVMEVTSVAGATSEGMGRSGESLGNITSLISDLDTIIQSMAQSQVGQALRTGDGPLVVWSDDLSVNIREIDNQHKQLVELINELADAMKQRKTKAVMLDVVSRLNDYVVVHFGYEEKLFKKHQYPDREAHSNVHRVFVEKVLGVEADLKSGRVTVSMDLLQFLKDWLIKHIRGTDKQYSAYLNSKGVR